MCFASLYVPTSGNQGDLTAIEKRLVLKKSFVKAQKDSRDLNSEDVEEQDV